MGPSLSIFQRFRQSRSGNVALIFALLAVPVIGAMGVAVDYARLSAARSRLADAADAAVLAVGGQPPMTDAAAKALVAQWMTAQMTDTQVSSWKVDSVAQANGIVTVQASAIMPMTLTSVFGIQTLPVSVVSQATRQVKKVELALALDNTGSMDTDNNIGALRDAATNLVNILYASSDASANIKTALVPFVTAVNIKTSGSYSDSWIDTQGQAKYNGANFDKATAPDGKVDHLSLFKKINVDWKGCVESRAEPYDTSDAAPDASKPDTLFVPYLWPDEPDSPDVASTRTVTSTSQYDNSYLPDQLDSTVTNPVRQRSAAKYNSSNSNTILEKAADGARGPNKSCAQPILDLTNDSAAVKTQIAAMLGWHNSGTNISEGLTWGWRVLSPTPPFTKGVAYNDPNTTKIVVLMTDGMNEVYRPDSNKNNQNRSDYSAIGYLNGYPNAGFSQQSRFGAGTPSIDTGKSNLNSKLTTICTAMKAKAVNIQIYTITFEVGDTSTQSLFRNCATSPTMYYNSPTQAALKQAFSDIAGSITQLRISQ